MKSTIALAAVLLGGLVLRAETGLFEAVRNGDLAMMRALLRSGVDPNSRNYIRQMGVDEIYRGNSDKLASAANP